MANTREINRSEQKEHIAYINNEFLAEAMKLIEDALQEFHIALLNAFSQEAAKTKNVSNDAYIKFYGFNLLWTQLSTILQKDYQNEEEFETFCNEIKNNINAIILQACEENMVEHVQSKADELIKKDEIYTFICNIYIEFAKQHAALKRLLKKEFNPIELEWVNRYSVQINVPNIDDVEAPKMLQKSIFIQKNLEQFLDQKISKDALLFIQKSNQKFLTILKTIKEIENKIKKTVTVLNEDKTLIDQRKNILTEEYKDLLHKIFEFEEGITRADSALSLQKSYENIKEEINHFSEKLTDFHQNIRTYQQKVSDQQQLLTTEITQLNQHAKKYESDYQKLIEFIDTQVVPFDTQTQTAYQMTNESIDRLNQQIALLREKINSYRHVPSLSAIQTSLALLEQLENADSLFDILKKSPNIFKNQVATLIRVVDFIGYGNAWYSITPLLKKHIEEISNTFKLNISKANVLNKSLYQTLEDEIKGKGNASILDNANTQLKKLEELEVRCKEESQSIKRQAKEKLAPYFFQKNLSPQVLIAKLTETTNNLNKLHYPAFELQMADITPQTEKKYQAAIEKLQLSEKNEAEKIKNEKLMLAWCDIWLKDIEKIDLELTALLETTHFSKNEQKEFENRLAKIHKDTQYSKTLLKKNKLQAAKSSLEETERKIRSLRREMLQTKEDQDKEDTNATINLKEKSHHAFLSTFASFLIFLKRHWKTLLLFTAAGTILGLIGVLTGGLGPAILGGGSAAYMGGGIIAGSTGLGLGVGIAAAHLPTKTTGMWGFFCRHKWKILGAGLIGGLVVGGLLTGGIVAGAGVALGIAGSFATLCGVGSSSGAIIATATLGGVGSLLGSLFGATIGAMADLFKMRKARKTLAKEINLPADSPKDKRGLSTSVIQDELSKTPPPTPPSSPAMATSPHPFQNSLKLKRGANFYQPTPTAKAFVPEPSFSPEPS